MRGSGCTCRDAHIHRRRCCFWLEKRAKQSNATIRSRGRKNRRALGHPTLPFPACEIAGDCDWSRRLLCRRFAGNVGRRSIKTIPPKNPSKINVYLSESCCIDTRVSVCCFAIAFQTTRSQNYYAARGPTLTVCLVLCMPSFASTSIAFFISFACFTRRPYHIYPSNSNLSEGRTRLTCDPCLNRVITLAAPPLVNFSKYTSFSSSVILDDNLNQRFRITSFCASVAGDSRHFALRYNLRVIPVSWT